MNLIKRGDLPAQTGDQTKILSDSSTQDISGQYLIIQRPYRSQPVNIIRRNLIANKMKPSDLFVVDFDLHQQVPAKLMLMWNHSASEGKDALL